MFSITAFVCARMSSVTVPSSAMWTPSCVLSGRRDEVPQRYTIAAPARVG